MLESAETACPETQPGAGRIERLPHVSGVDERDAVGVNAVAPLGAVRHDRPVKHHVGLGRPFLAAQCLGYSFRNVLDRVQKLERMDHWQIVVRAGPQTLHVPDDQIRFKLVARTAARHGADGRIRLAADLLDALRCPQKEREFVRRHSLVRIDPGAPPVTDEAHKVVFQRKAGKISRESDALALLRHRRFYKRRLRQLPVLIGLERFLVRVPLQWAFEKLPSLLNDLLLNGFIKHGCSPSRSR